MPLIKPKTIEDLKTEFTIALRNNSGGSITKVTKNSVAAGMAFANSKIVQKIVTTAAQLESRLFPELANNSALDTIADNNGIPARNQTSASSVILLFEATAATVYPVSFQVKNADGLIFETKEELAITAHGYGFANAECTTTGDDTNVDAYTLDIAITTPPAGHISVTNPYMAVNGKDVESFIDYKNFILNVENILSKDTIAFYRSLLRNEDRNIVRIYTQTVSGIENKFEIYVVKNSGGEFSAPELTALKTDIQNFIPLSDFGSNTMEIKNVVYTDIDMFVPVKIDASYVLADVLKDMQINVSLYMDMTVWEFGETLQWDDLLEVCKKTEGVLEVYDKDFTPNGDVPIPVNSLPRIAGFTIKDVINDIQIGIDDIPVMWQYREKPYENKLLS